MSDVLTRGPAIDPARVQRLTALEQANAIRSRRAQLKRDLRTGRETVHTVLTDPPEWAMTMRVGDLLRAVPLIGKCKVARVLSRTKLSPSKTLGAMTVRQRSEVLFELSGYPSVAGGMVKP